MQYGINCVKMKLRYKTNPSVQVAYLTPNAVGNAPLPENYEYYTKVGINVGGQLFTLSVNEDLVLQRSYDCGVPTEEPSDLDALVANTQVGFPYPYGYWFSDHFRAGQYVGEMYGIGGGFNRLGYFKIDEQMRQISLYNVPVTTVIMEYVGDDQINGGTLVPMMAVETIRAYIHWQLNNYNPKMMGIAQEYKMQFNKAFAEYIQINSLPTIQDYLDNTWASYRSSPKR